MLGVRVFSALTLCALLIITGISVFGSSGSMSSDDPDMTGVVLEVTDSGNRFLLEGDEDLFSGEPNLVWVSLGKDTITLWEDETRQGAIETGQRVEVWFAGPLLLSYPAQGGASQIRVLVP